MATVDDLGELGQRAEAVAVWALRSVLFALLAASATRAASSLSALEAPCFFLPVLLFLPVLPLAGFVAETRGLLDGPYRVLDVVFGHVRVPNVQGVHGGEIGHPRPVGLDRLDGHRPRVGGGEAVVAGCDREAGGHPLEVVLKRSRQVSSNSLRPNSSCRSGEAKPPKLDR